jgi:hypothetical protein
MSPLPFLILALPLLGGCELFDDTVVPPVDSSPPIAAPTLYQGGDYVWATGKTWTTSSKSQGYIVLAASYDWGGARKVTLNRHATALYAQGDIGAYQFAALAPIVETQSGGVGQTVSNGVWTGDWVQPGKMFAATLSGMPLQWVEYTWSVTAENFHGGVSTTPGGTIRYEP